MSKQPIRRYAPESSSRVRHPKSQDTTCTPRYVFALEFGLMSQLAELALRVLAKQIKLAPQISSFNIQRRTLAVIDFVPNCSECMNGNGIQR